MTEKQKSNRVHYIHHLSIAFQQRMVGVFVLAAVLVLAGLLFLQVQSAYILDDRIVYDTYLSNAQGVSTETLVNVSGIDVGQVESIDITEQNKVHVRFYVYERFQRLLRSDSKAELSKLSVIGNAVIIITAGSHELPILPPESIIFTEEPVTIDELIAELTPAINNLNVIVEKVAALVNVIEPQQLQSTAQNVTALVADLREITGHINQGQGAVGKLLKDPAVADDVTDMVSNLGGLVDAAAPAVQKLDPLVQNIDTLVAEVNANMQQLRGLLSETERRVDELSKVIEPAAELMQRSLPIADDVKATSGVVSQEIRQLPEMINKMQNLLNATDRTLQNAQQVWPLSTVIAPRDQSTRIKSQPLDD